MKNEDWINRSFVYYLHLTMFLLIIIPSAEALLVKLGIEITTIITPNTLKIYFWGLIFFAGPFIIKSVKELQVYMPYVVKIFEKNDLKINTETIPKVVKKKI